MTELISNQMINDLFDYFTALKEDGLLYKKKGSKYVTYRNMNGSESTGKKSLKKIHIDMSKINEPLFVELTMMHYGSLNKNLVSFIQFIVESIVTHEYTKGNFIGLVRLYVKFLNGIPPSDSDYECGDDE